GDAAVDVSIVNWIKQPEDALAHVLDGVAVDSISPSLRPGDIAEPLRLRANRGVAFQGMLPGANYVVECEVAERLRDETAVRYADVVRPYLSGDDIATDPRQHATRYVADFGVMTLEDARRYPLALQIVQLQAKHSREESTSYHRNPQWWQFLWPRP